MSTFSNRDNDDAVCYTLVEVVQRSSLQEQFVLACVECGVLEMAEPAPQQWLFTSDMCQQLDKAWRLHNDLDVHLHSLPLVLDLLGEVEQLRHEVQFLRQRLRHWEPD